MSTGSPGSGTEIIATRILRAAGLDPDSDVTRQGLGVSESADALKDGKIAAFFWSGGLPTAAVQDLAHTTGITIRMIPTGDLVPRCSRSTVPLYFAARPARGGVPGDRRRRARRRRGQRAGRQRVDARAAGLRHHAAAVREAAASLPPFIPRRATCRPIARPVRPGAVPSWRHQVLSRKGRVEAVAVEAEPRRERAAGRGWAGRAAAVLAAALAGYALYWVLFIVQPQVYRVSFLLVALVLTFLLFPRQAAARTRRTGVARARLDCSIGADGRRARLAARRLRAVRLPRRRRRDRRSRARHARRSLLVLEATRRTVGWILPVTAARVPRSTRWLGPLLDARPGAARAPRLRPRPARRHALHDARRHLRRAARRRRDLHHPVHDLRRGARAVRRRRVLHRLGDGGERHVRAAAPGRTGHARRVSCSAPSRAAASRRR